MSRRPAKNLLFVCFLALALSAGPARAFDPILTLIISIAREITYEAFEQSRRPRQPNMEPLPQVYPGTMVEPSKLRALIDESFFYLSERRREELFDTFNTELLKPENAAVRSSMIAYFAERAVAVRRVMDRLTKLSEPEMRELAQQFAAEASALPPAERAKLRKVLEDGLLPVPPDLNHMLVVAVANLPSSPSETELAERKAAGGGPGKGPKPQTRAPGAGVATEALSVKPQGVSPGSVQRTPGGASTAVQ